MIHQTPLHTKTNRAFHTCRWAHCCFHPILNLEVQVATAHPSQLQKVSHLPAGDFARRNNFNENPPITHWYACSFSPKNSVRFLFFSVQMLLYEFLCPPEPGFNVVRWRPLQRFGKESHDDFEYPKHGPTAWTNSSKQRAVKIQQLAVSSAWLLIATLEMSPLLPSEDSGALK